MGDIFLLRVAFFMLVLKRGQTTRGPKCMKMFLWYYMETGIQLLKEHIRNLCSFNSVALRRIFLTQKPKGANMKASENKLQQECRCNVKSHYDDFEYNGTDAQNNQGGQYSKTDIQKHEGNKWTFVDVTCYAVVIGFVLVFFLTCLDTCNGKIPSVLEDNDYGYYMMTKNNIPDTLMQNTKHKTERNKTAQFYNTYNRTQAIKYKMVAVKTR